MKQASSETQKTASRVYLLKLLPPRTTFVPYRVIWKRVYNSSNFRCLALARERERERERWFGKGTVKTSSASEQDDLHMLLLERWELPAQRIIIRLFKTLKVMTQRHDNRFTNYPWKDIQTYSTQKHPHQSPDPASDPIYKGPGKSKKNMPKETTF